MIKNLLSHGKTIADKNHEFYLQWGEVITFERGDLQLTIKTYRHGDHIAHEKLNA
jgi:hypothetical protein